MVHLRRRPVAWAVALAVIAALAIVWAQADSETVQRENGLEVVADGFNRPTFAGAAPGDDALWVAEQPGRLLRVDGDDRRVVVDLSTSVRLDAEQGLLGVVFGPDFATTRDVYLHYSDHNGDTTVAEYQIGDDWRARQRRILLRVDQPYENHKGGALAFGPDGRLYIGLGDGGGAFDPDDRAQDPTSKLGKLLAADIGAAGAPEWKVVAYGLRNPWRFWFDPAMGHAWIADVGQDEQEEIDRVRIHEDGAAPNLGWPAYEGTKRLPGRRLRGDGELIAPAHTYSHSVGCSVTGGLIQRGGPQRLDGRYVFGDFCSGRIWSLEVGRGDRVGAARLEPFRAPQLTHIGTDHDGRLLFVTADGFVRAPA